MTLVENGLININVAFKALNTRFCDDTTLYHTVCKSGLSWITVEQPATFGCGKVDTVFYCPLDKAYETLRRLFSDVMDESVVCLCSANKIPYPMQKTLLDRAQELDIASENSLADNVERDRQKCQAVWLYLQANRARQLDSMSHWMCALGIVRCALGSSGRLLSAKLNQSSLSYFARFAVGCYANSGAIMATPVILQLEQGFFEALTQLVKQGHVLFPHCWRSTVSNIQQSIERKWHCHPQASAAANAIVVAHEYQGAAVNVSFDDCDSFAEDEVESVAED